MTVAQKVLAKFRGNTAPPPLTERIRAAVTAGSQISGLEGKINTAKSHLHGARSRAANARERIASIDQRVEEYIIPSGGYEQRTQRSEWQRSLTEAERDEKAHAAELARLERQLAEARAAAPLPAPDPEEHRRLSERYKAVFAEREALHRKLSEQQGLLREAPPADLDELRNRRSELVADVALGTAKQTDLDQLDKAIEELTRQDELHQQRIKNARNALPALQRRVDDTEHQLRTIATERDAHRELAVLQRADQAIEDYLTAAAQLAEQWAFLVGLQQTLKPRLPALERARPWIAQGRFRVSTPHGFTVPKPDYTAATERAAREASALVTTIEEPRS